MNIQGLIERYEKFKDSKKKMTSVDLVLKDLRTLDEPEPLPFKLKDVVRRIRGFDPTTQTRWLNDILKELGDDYGSMKYREGYEQGKFEGAWVGNQLKDADKIRQELNKVRVQQCVADWIEYCKDRKITLAHALYHSEEAKNKSVYRWLFEESGSQEKFARAWLVGWIDDEMMPGVQVVEKVVYKESPTARLPDYFNNNNDGKIIKWKQSRRYRGGRN